MNGFSANSMVRLAANLGTANSLASVLDGVPGSGRLQRLGTADRGVVERQIEYLLELDDVVDLGAHGDVGDALEDELDHDRHLVFLHPLPRGGERRLRLMRIGDADRLAAQPFRDRDMVDAV